WFCSASACTHWSVPDGHAATEPPASTWATLPHGTSPTCEKAPPMYQPPLLSGTTAYTVPIIFGNDGSGCRVTASSGTPAPVGGPTVKKSPPTYTVLPLRAIARTPSLSPSVTQKSGRTVGT